MVVAAKRSSVMRDPGSVVASVHPIALAVAESVGLVLWGVTFGKDAGRETLRVAVDRQGGVTADDLAAVSEQLSRELDRSDAVPGDRQYVLEVTSPGAERTLETKEQFAVCVGRTAKITLKDGRTLEGPIAGVTEHSVEIAGEEDSVRALFEDIAKARLVVKL